MGQSLPSQKFQGSNCPVFCFVLSHFPGLRARQKNQRVAPLCSHTVPQPKQINPVVDWHFCQRLLLFTSSVLSYTKEADVLLRQQQICLVLHLTKPCSVYLGRGPFSVCLVSTPRLQASVRISVSEPCLVPAPTGYSTRQRKWSTKEAGLLPSPAHASISLEVSGIS